jgi:disulfide bond formation protein DsbB
MDHKAVEQILSLLAFAGLVWVALTWIGALAERLGVGRIGSGIADTIDGAEIWLAWIVALVAVSGSLYFSESVGYIPCLLCWYQRIGMYPMVILLLVAIVRRERVVAPYALFLAGAGLVVSIYHYQLEWFPDQASLCSTTATVPCHIVWFKHFGVSTIPFLAGSGFLMIGTLMAIAWRNERRRHTDSDEESDEDVSAAPEPDVELPQLESA